MRGRDVIAALERRYDPRWAEDWDAVGLVCGDPDDEVRRVHFAVDPVESVVDEAIELGADLVVTHHPLLLGGTESVAATTAKGRVVHRLIRHGIGLYVAHTNADVARPGVSDALAAVLGVHDTEPLAPLAADRPGESASDRDRDRDRGLGLGRVGRLATDTTLRGFLDTVAAALPATAWGVRAAGDPQRPVARVAVCGGSGGELAEAAASAGADVLVTSDLKHHSTSEALADYDIGLIDAAHWATEQPWLAMAADLLVGDLREMGITVETAISTRITDPWTMHAPAVRTQ
jgi:dinuclear metal center YbgI/SA1388 family protein